MTGLLRKGFTLIEVNLAVFIMAGGILAMISLYTFGYRENRQSREDVAAAACADDVLNRLMLALSSTNITWEAWKRLPYISNGSAENGAKKWSDYLTIGGDGSGTWRVAADPYSTAQSVFQAIMNAVRSDVSGDKAIPGAAAECPAKPGTGSGKMTFALVAFRDSKESPMMTMSLRAVRESRWRSLMMQPIFFSEVHFQGLRDSANGGGGR